MLHAMQASRIQLDPYTLHEASETGKIIIPATVFETMFNQVTSSPSRIIFNLSLRTSKDLESVRSRLGRNHRNFLFVAAAGNGTGGKGQELKSDTGDRFPAIYGGPLNSGAANLVTVAALYRDAMGIWKPAPFSDFGSRFVEIGAPGCEVPVLHYNDEEQSWITQSATGTSFSAPLVSFAAGLVAAEMPEGSSSEVKQRILVASDLNPQLVDHITDRRSLNLPKALAVHYDVVETEREMFLGDATFKNQETEAVYGWNQEIPISCASRERAIKVEKILKIVPFFNRLSGSATADKFPDRVYAMLGDGDQISLLDCKLSEDIIIFLRRPGAIKSLRFEWAELQDVTLRQPRYRQ